MIPRVDAEPIIPFPVAFLVGTFVTDLTFIGTGDGFWARGSMWLNGAAIVMALLVALGVLRQHQAFERVCTNRGALGGLV